MHSLSNQSVVVLFYSCLGPRGNSIERAQPIYVRVGCLRIWHCPV